MRMRSFAALLSTVGLLASAAAANAAIDKVVFRDTNLPLSWMNGASADTITAYFTGKGYTQVDAAKLKDFMTKHVGDQATSVVIFANDIVPDSIMNSVNGQPNPNSLFNQYLRNGGKAIYLADWPAYYVAMDDGSKPTWGDTGAAAAFGFYPAKWGFDGKGAVTFTDEGKKWGLTKPWSSQRATDPNEVDLILGTVAGGGAMPWVKQYTNRPGAGFTFLYDFPNKDGDFGPDELAQIQRVAEYFPAGEFKLTTKIHGVLTGADGKPVANATIRVKGNNVKRVLATDANGNFSVFVDPGTYNVGLGGVLPADPTAANVTVAQDKTGEVTLQRGQVVDLSSDAGQKWELQVPAKDSKEDPNKVATDPASAFQSYPVPGDWTSDILTGGAGDNTDAWYRTKVTVPDAFVGKDVVLGGFNMDDIDYTYWNGQYLGSMNVWNAKRAYAIPGAWVKKTNDLVILNHNGGGGAGISQSAPTLSLLQSGGAIQGQLVDQNKAGVAGVTVTATGKGGAFGDQVTTSTTDANGNFLLAGLGAGSYVVSFSGAAPGTALPADSAATAVAAGQLVSYNQTANIPVPVAKMSLRAADLKAGQGWKFLGQTEVDNGPDKDKSRKTIEDNADKYGALNYTDTGKDSILTNATWIADWPYVPGDAGPDGRAGTPGGIPDNTDWVNRIHITLSGDMDKGDRYEITDFNDDDALYAAYFNGVKLSGFQGGWDTKRTLIIPANAVNHGGKDNVFTLVGVEYGGGAGFNKDYGGPTLIALAPVAAVTPTVKIGDVTGDGKVNIADATMILQFVVKLKTPTDAQKAAADINHDGTIDIKDVTLLLKAIVNGTADQLK